MVRGGEGDGQLWGSGRGAIAGCNCRGAIVVGYGWVDVVPLLGATVVCYGGGRGGWRPTLAEWTWCHCRVPLQCAMVGGEGDDQLWRSGRGAIAGCRCSVLLWAGGVTTNFGGVDVVPLIAQKLVFAIWGLCWYNFNRRNMKKTRLDQKFFGCSNFANQSILVYLAVLSSDAGMQDRSSAQGSQQHVSWVSTVFLFRKQFQSCTKTFSHSSLSSNTAKFPSKSRLWANKVSKFAMQQRLANGGTGKNHGELLAASLHSCDASTWLWRPPATSLEGRSSHGEKSKPQGLGASLFGWQGFF